jgi:hypothetical protein
MDFGVLFGSFERCRYTFKGGLEEYTGRWVGYGESSDSSAVPLDSFGAEHGDIPWLSTSIILLT